MTVATMFSLVSATDRQWKRLVLCYGSCEPGETRRVSKRFLCEQRSVMRHCRGFDEASTAKVRQTRGRNRSQWETVIVQDKNEYKSGELL